MLLEARGMGSSGTGVKSSCELPNVCSGTHTLNCSAEAICAINCYAISPTSKFIYLFIIIIFVFRDRVSLYSSGCPGIPQNLILNKSKVMCVPLCDRFGSAVGQGVQPLWRLDMSRVATVGLFLCILRTLQTLSV